MFCSLGVEKAIEGRAGGNSKMLRFSLVIVRINMMGYESLRGTAHGRCFPDACWEAD